MADVIQREIERPDQFRILIIGRANAGKTTILRAVCGTEEEPDVYDRDGNKIIPNQIIPRTRSVFRATYTTLRSIRARVMRRAPDSILASDPLEASNPILAPSALRGEHNIEYSLIFPSSPGFVFHDSRGFESGAADELEVVRKFIQDKASLGSMKNQLHAIWYCFSADNNRFMTAADKEFFDTIDTGSVPVIAIFTKFDAPDSVAFSALSAQGVPFEEAQKRAPEHAQAQFDQDVLPLIKKVAHPPRAEVYLRNMHSKGSPDTILKAATELIESTEAALDDGALKILLVQAQHINVGLHIKRVVNRGVITKAAQYALQEDPTTFNPLQYGLISSILEQFPFIWDLNTAAFIAAVTPLIPSLHSMPPPLQIISVGCAAIIIGAKAFWLHPGETKPQHITAASQYYFQSSTAEDVRMAILEAFKGPPELYDTPEGKAALLQVVLANQMSS
ncbi:hypothetical protein BOTBODRAFT_28140 [Botryobasidium botryosum FD-172 SS1]|uniref:Uncharacterized protein n=1 Tax=Botryobasidium botryosum (strain FD-172 SS1) TaxID=930990 RepID=A0A067MUY2_BOTB1|nr:hypothetical protein BOTBODRAFT_28140 [Botryobasidium botryosum FD-172 SS1]